MSLCPYKSPIPLLLLLGVIPPCRFTSPKKLEKTPKTLQIPPNPGGGGAPSPVIERGGAPHYLPSC